MCDEQVDHGRPQPAPRLADRRVVDHPDDVGHGSDHCERRNQFALHDASLACRGGHYQDWQCILFISVCALFVKNILCCK